LKTAAIDVAAPQKKKENNAPANTKRNVLTERKLRPTGAPHARPQSEMTEAKIAMQTHNISYFVI